jgi:TolA-binding protein
MSNGSNIRLERGIPMTRLSACTTLLAAAALAAGQTAHARGTSACPGGAITKAEAKELASEPLFSVTDIMLMKHAPNIGPNVLAKPAKGFRVLKARLKGKSAGSLGHTKQLLRVAEYCEAVAMHRWTAARILDRRARRAIATGRKANAAKLKKAHTRRLADVRKWGERGLSTFASIQTVIGRMNPAGFTGHDRVLLGGAHLSSLLAELYRRQAKGAKGTRAQTLQKKKQQRETGMLRYLRNLIRNYPRSLYIPHAMAVMADHYMNKGQTAVALKFFMRVTRYRGQSAVARYGQFGLGRCYALARRHAKALAEFYKVLGSAATLAQSDPLLEATQHGLVKAFAKVGRPDKALTFFARVARGQTHVVQKMFLLLGAVYVSTGRKADARKIYARAQTRWPKNPARCRWRKTYRALR